MEAEEAADPNGACGVTASESIEALSTAGGGQATEPEDGKTRPERAPAEEEEIELEDIKSTRVGAD